jgi:hypothetical protein
MFIPQKASAVLSKICKLSQARMGGAHILRLDHPGNACQGQTL